VRKGSPFPITALNLICGLPPDVRKGAPFPVGTQFESAAQPPRCAERLSLSDHGSQFDLRLAA
jgi:hypothetical protein